MAKRCQRNAKLRQNHMNRNLTIAIVLARNVCIDVSPLLDGSFDEKGNPSPALNNLTRLSAHEINFICEVASVEIYWMVAPRLRSKVQWMASPHMMVLSIIQSMSHGLQARTAVLGLLPIIAV